MLSKEIQEIIQYNSQKIIQIRRYLHAHPELSGKENLTSDYIYNIIREIGIKKIIRYNNYGITALIEGNSNSPIIGIRADMDALPILEENDVDYKSVNAGVMHACGHDVHMAVLLGVAMVLQNISSSLNGSIKLIFQPSEEVLPGGAFEMIQNGVLDNPSVDCMLGLHVLPELEAGKFGFRKGEFMSSSDEIHLTIKGRGGHAAFPQLLNDPLLAASSFIMETEQQMKKFIPTDVPFVLKFGRCFANGKTNIVPDEVEIEGTFRIFNEKWRELAHKHLASLLNDICTRYQTKPILNIIKGYPILINHTELTENIISGFKTIFSDDSIVELPMRMTSDDFAYYTQILPSCYFRLGVAENQSDIIKPLHTSRFDINETAIDRGIEAMISAVLSGINYFVQTR